MNSRSITYQLPSLTRLRRRRISSRSITYEQQKQHISAAVADALGTSGELAGRCRSMSYRSMSYQQQEHHV